ALTADEKSPVTGDCHAGSLWEPGGEIPPGHPTPGRDLRALAITQPKSSGGARASSKGAILPREPARPEAAKLDCGKRGQRRPFVLAPQTWIGSG
ncbi:MAG: hypothetical protein M0008_14165, partial [Actinomycetota bacterium]|nr:hypothetical protein [Actinomycetota bacterium]